MSRLQRLPLALVALAACAHYRPPFAQPPGATAQTDPHQAAMVFLWPPTSCDPPGYFTLATADGKFIGTIARGSRLSVLVPAGERTVIAWNDVMEGATRSVGEESVPVLHADLREGRTYYVRMVFGEWDGRGPPERPYAARRCIETPESATSAMVALSPASADWEELPEWMSTLEAIVPDRAAGQAWLDGNPALLESNLAVGQDRFALLRPRAKVLATINPGDGAP